MNFKEQCFNILDKHMKKDLTEFWLEAFNKPDIWRVTSHFQIYDFETKLRQYYYTSLNIKFGNALEEIVYNFLLDNGAEFLNRHEEVENKDCDQIFMYQNKVVLIEQKIRDDHDSSKKEGQVQNFLTKKTSLENKYDNVYCSFWFIDDCVAKNKNYYSQQLAQELYYGADIEKFLQTIFEDNRAKGFVQKIEEILEEYAINFKTINIFENVYLDYRKIASKTLYFLWKNEKILAQVVHFFFDDKQPSNEEMLAYLKTKRGKYAKDLIKFLKEEKSAQ